MWSKWFVVALAAILLGAAAGVGFYSGPIIEVTTAAVSAGDITRRIAAIGTLQAVITVEVGTQVSGTVQSVEADYNAPVRVGQVLARIDDSSYDAQLRESQAALAAVQADVIRLQTLVEDAETKFTRAAELSARHLIPRSDLDDARIAMEEARADLRTGESAATQAQAAADEAAVSADHTIIRSPIDGIVIDRTVDVGQTLAASLQSPVLFRIAGNLRTMQVNVDVDESDVEALEPGQPIAFTVESYPGETFHGTLRELRLQPVNDQAPRLPTVAMPTALPAASTVGSVVSYSTIVDVANPDERLRPGMTAEVILAGSRRDQVIRIPNSALSFSPTAEVLAALGEREPPKAPQGARDVWQYDGKRLTPIAVRTGMADGGWTELVSGAIRPGDVLVTAVALHAGWL